MLVPDERCLRDQGLRIAACPFPDADVVEALWDQLYDAYHARRFLRDFDAVLGRITEQVLSLPRLTWWVRRGRASQVVHFLLSSQHEFLLQAAPWPNPLTCEHSSSTVSRTPDQQGGLGCELDEDGHGTDGEALYNLWFATRAPAAITAHRLLSGEICLEAVESKDIGCQIEDGLPQLVREEVMMTEGGAEAGEVTCHKEMEVLRHSWLCFRTAEVQRAEQRRSALRARVATRLEREQRHRTRRLQRASSQRMLGNPCTHWAGQREWRRRQ